MKKSMIIAAAIFAFGAYAVTKSATVAQMKAVANSYASLLKDGGEGEPKAGGCQFEVSQTSKGLSLTVTTDKAGSITLNVPKNASISLELQESGDGSFQKTYSIGAGSLQVVHADDAYDEVTVATDKGSHTCGLYY